MPQGLIGKNQIDREFVTQVYHSLADGNRAIYMDIFPTTLAYISLPGGNIQAVRDMQPHADLLEAWERLHTARITGIQEDLWTAAVQMVEYEQRVILQGVFASTPEQQQFWTTFSQSVLAGKVRAPYPGAAKFVQVLPNGDYGDADDRMQWFHQELYPKGRQWLEAHPDGIDLETLLSGGYGT